MPPKGKSASKKPAKTKTAATLIDGLTKEEMSKEQMIEHIVRLREELDREREERNYFQLERDKMNTFREVAGRHLQEASAQLRNLNNEIEEDEWRHQVEIKVYKQKMKHLLCEHQNVISELRADGFASTEGMKREQARLEDELVQRMGDIRVDIEELGTEDLVRDLELRHSERMTDTRSDWEKQLTEVQASYEDKLETLQQELDNTRKVELSGRKDQWNALITALKSDHDKILGDAIALLNHDVEQNLDLADFLKKQTEDLKAKQKEKEKDLAGFLPDNDHLNQLLSKAKEETTEVEKKMKHPIRRKDPNEKVKEKELNDQKRDCELLQQKLGELQLERDKLHEAFAQNIRTVQRKADQKNMVLEKRLEALADSSEKTQAQLSSVLSASNMDTCALGGITSKTEDIIDSSNKHIKDLQYKKTQIHKALLLVSQWRTAE